MFLALTPVVAAGRGLFALAVVVLSMSGHATVGHMHLDVSRSALAFVLLLAVAWRTNDARTLLLASAVAQCMVHGGIPVSSPAMFCLHLAGTFAAFALISRFEALWGACVSMLRPLLSPATLYHPSVPQSRPVHCTVWHNPFQATHPARFTLRRGPPALA